MSLYDYTNLQPKKEIKFSYSHVKLFRTFLQKYEILKLTVDTFLCIRSYLIKKLTGKTIMQRIYRKFFTLLLGTTLFLSAVTGCSSQKEETADKVVLNEVAHSIFYAPMYVAIEKGYFEAEGIDVELVTGYGADKTMTAVLAGEADIGFMGSEASIYTYLGKTDDYVVNFAQLTQRAGNFLVSREPIEHFDWSMIKGSYVLGGRAGGMPEMVLEYILKKQGIDPKTDLTIDQSIDFGSTAAAFSGAKEGEKGYADFTVEFEPHATSLEQKGDGHIVASLGKASGYVPYTAFCAKQSYIQNNPQIIQSFTNALQKGMNFVNHHSAKEIADIIQPQFPETDNDTLITIIERYAEQDTWNTNLIFKEDSFTLLQNILEESGELPQRVPYEALVNTSFAQKASSME